jgi:hypothetical protein
MQVFSLSADTRKVSINLGLTGLSIPAMALELLPFGATSWTSVSQPPIQDVGGGLYEITLTAEQVNVTGYILISLTGSGFNPFLGYLFTVYRIEDSDPISGVPVNQDAFLPVQAFSGVSPVTGLLVADFSLAYKRADELTFTPKIPVELIEPVNEFSVARGVYLIKFVAAELSRVGDFTYTASGPDFNSSIQILQLAEPTRTTAIFEVRDSGPDLISPSVSVPDSENLEVFIGTTQPTNSLDFRFSQFGFNYVDLAFEYFNGTIFTPLTATDNTQGFTENGQVTWVLPLDQTIGGTGAPDQTNYFIKISATAIAGDAEVATVNPETLVEGVLLTVLNTLGEEVISGTTSDLGQFSTPLVPGPYTVTLRQNSKTFSFNNIRVTVKTDEELRSFGTTDSTQRVLLEGSSISIPDPSVDPDLVLLKTDLVNLSGNPVQRQEIRLEHRFLPVHFGGSKTILGRTVNIITDDRGHAEVRAVADSQVDVFLVNTFVSRQIRVPRPRSGTGSSSGGPPTPTFISTTDQFAATDLQGIITINGVDYVITRVVDTTEIEVSPDISAALVAVPWSMTKVDIFALVSLAPDQFSVSIPTFENFSIRTTL